MSGVVPAAATVVRPEVNRSPLPGVLSDEMSERGRSERMVGVRGVVGEPDGAVAAAAAAGDPWAFEEIVRRYQGPVWRFLCRHLGDPDLAQDVAQETFVRVHRGLPGFDGRSKLTTWMFQIARNAAVDAQRAAQRRARLVAVADPPRPVPDASLGAELQAALDTLPPKLREALLLVEVTGLTYREAAEVLDAPEGTVKSRVFHARDRLVRWMEGGEAR